MILNNYILSDKSREIEEMEDVIPGLFTYVIVQQERRAQEIEKTAPDFLRQLSSMLQVGLSFENAMEDMSQYGEGPLYDEMSQWSGSISNNILDFYKE